MEEITVFPPRTDEEEHEIWNPENRSMERGIPLTKNRDDYVVRRVSQRPRSILVFLDQRRKPDE